MEAIDRYSLTFEKLLEAMMDRKQFDACNIGRYICTIIW